MAGETHEVSDFVSGITEEINALDAGDLGYTPSGGLSGTDVQAAMDELEANKCESSDTVKKLIDEFADAATTGTSSEDLYANSLPADTLASNGYSLRGDFAGSYGANTNQKVVWLEFAGTDLGALDVTENGTNWVYEFRIIRVSNTVVRYWIKGISSASQVTNTGEITSLDLDNTAYDLDFRGRTPIASGDLTAELGAVEIRPGV